MSKQKRKKKNLIYEDHFDEHHFEIFPAFKALILTQTQPITSQKSERFFIRL